MRDSKGCEDLQLFEKVLSNVAAGCEYNYGAMGRVGFLYDSMKDRLKWSKLSIKRYARIVSQVGQILSMDEKDYKKEKVKAMQMSADAIAEALKAAFGDGK